MTDKAVQTIDESQHTPTPYQSNALTPMDMVQKAIEGGSGIEVIEKLMALQERYDAAQARKAFDQAMAEAKAKIPTIGKNRTVKYGKGDNETSYSHEDLAQIAEVVTPILSEFGLSYRFETNSTDGITVTCIISHRDGHSERNSLKSSPDGSGGKNSIQAIGSAVTYLQRYTLKAALGLAASADDDGKGADGPMVLNSSQFKWIIDHAGIVTRIRTAPTFKVLGNVRDLLASLEFINPMTRKDWAEEVKERAKELDTKLGAEMTGKEQELDDTGFQKFLNILWEFEQQVKGLDAAGVSEVASEYEPLLEGASQKIWTQFNAIVKGD